MATALDMIKRSMRLAGVLGEGETPTATEASDALTAFNSMLDSWSIERLMVYSMLQENFTWTAAQSSRTIGSGGNFSTTRPTRIENGYTKIGGIDYPYRVVTKEFYDAIVDKTTQGSFPEVVYYEQKSPLGVIYAWPVPSASIDIYVNSWRQLQQFTALTTDLALPAGYQYAIEYNGAIQVALEWQVAVRDDVRFEARRAKAALKRVNDTPLVARLEVSEFQGAHYNINSDR